MDSDDAVAAVVAFTDDDALWVEENEEGVEGGEAGGVGDYGAIEEAREDCFVAGGVGVGKARVDVAFWDGGILL